MNLFGAQVFTQALGEISDAQKQQDQRSYEKNFYDYQLQKQKEFWDMSNAYNSPKAQMERLKEAGLNPHLVYGNGATATGGELRSFHQQPSPDRRVSWSPDFLGTIAAGLDIEAKKVEVDNLKKVGESINLKNLRSKFDLEYKQQVRQIDYNILNYRANNMEMDYNLKDQAYRFNDLKNAKTLDQMAVQLGISRQSLRNAQVQERILRATAALNESGLYPGDALWARMGTLLLKGIFPNFKLPRAEDLLNTFK